eukprot:m.200307 g.200307  ORF g.200307 m.200307 type:complete len:61 (-) comp18402_c0_seq15:1031-1213(-)
MPMQRPVTSRTTQTGPQRGLQLHVAAAAHDEVGVDWWRGATAEQPSEAFTNLDAMVTSLT